MNRSFRRSSKRRGIEGLSRRKRYSSSSSRSRRRNTSSRSRRNSVSMCTSIRSRSSNRGNEMEESRRIKRHCVEEGVKTR